MFCINICIYNGFAKISEVKIISKNKNFVVNDEIKEKEVRLLGDDGTQYGIVATIEAIRMAEEKDMDLVLMSPNAQPPVCKIMNIGKFIYEQAKKEKENKKNQKIVNLKEVRLSASIDEHDIEIKANNAKRFLNDGDKVKVAVRFRGREADYAFKGRKILDNFLSRVEELCIVEKPARLEGRNMIMILAPKKA